MFSSKMKLEVVFLLKYPDFSGVDDMILRNALSPFAVDIPNVVECKTLPTEISSSESSSKKS